MASPGLLYIWDLGLVHDLPDALLRDRIPVVLVQILNQTLLAQSADGGWAPEESLEITAYGVLTLTAVSSLPWHSLLHESIKSGIRSGQDRLSRLQSDWTKPIGIWIEKVTYGSATLSEAYCLAAMKAFAPIHQWSSRMTELIEIPEKVILKFVTFFSKLQAFQMVPLWKLRASAVESYTFLSQLKAARTDILPRQKMAKNDYIVYVPFTWILINNLCALHSNANLLWDSMVLTVCNFRVDEYMETAVATFSEADLQQIKPIIDVLCDCKQFDVLQPKDQQSQSSIITNGGNTDYAAVAQLEARESSAQVNSLDAHRTDSIIAEADEKYAVSSITCFRAVVGHYTRSMLAYPRILHASPADHSCLRALLRSFLLSHVAQVGDNAQFSTQASWSPSESSVFEKPRTSFYTWTHTTGADSVSCPFSFAFFTCLLGAASATLQVGQHRPTTDCFRSVRQKYLAEDLCSHLAVMSRLYNDFGSVVRDRLEANINSINFPEFHMHREDCDCAGGCQKNVDTMYEENLKKELLGLAELERQDVDAALTRLLSDIEGTSGDVKSKSQTRKANAVRLFVGVAKLYADIYVLRDLSNRIEKAG